MDEDDNDRFSKSFDVPLSLGGGLMVCAFRESADGAPIQLNIEIALGDGTGDKPAPAATFYMPMNQEEAVKLLLQLQAAIVYSTQPVDTMAVQGQPMELPIYTP